MVDVRARHMNRSCPVGRALLISQNSGDTLVKESGRRAVGAKFVTNAVLRCGSPLCSFPLTSVSSRSSVIRSARREKRERKGGARVSTRWIRLQTVGSLRGR